MAVCFACPAYAQEAACLYQGVLLATSLEWCNRNGQASQSGSQITNPSPSDAVKTIQMLLIGAGYDPGPIDGVRGQRTTAALKEFQRKTGLPQNVDPFDQTVIAKLIDAAEQRANAWLAANSQPQPPVVNRQDATNVARVGARIAARSIVEGSEHAAGAMKGAGALVVGVIAAIGFALKALFKFLSKKG